MISLLIKDLPLEIANCCSVKHFVCCFGRIRLTHASATLFSMIYAKCGAHHSENCALHPPCSDRKVINAKPTSCWCNSRILLGIELPTRWLQVQGYKPALLSAAPVKSGLSMAILSETRSDVQLPAMNTRLQAVVDILCWVLIALLVAATMRWIVWGSHQPRPHTIWGEPSEKPLN